jgi:hypothetical protein
MHSPVSSMALRRMQCDHKLGLGPQYVDFCRQQQLRRNHEAWRLGVTMQTGLGAGVIITAGVLAWHSKMDATIAGFLGVALGYVLGRKTG